MNKQMVTCSWIPEKKPSDLLILKELFSFWLLLDSLTPSTAEAAYDAVPTFFLNIYF